MEMWNVRALVRLDGQNTEGRSFTLREKSETMLMQALRDAFPGRRVDLIQQEWSRSF